MKDLPLAGRTRFGLVGINARAERLLLRGLAGSRRALVAAVCSRDAEKARRTAAACGSGVVPFTSVERMLERGHVDAIYVNTPATTHYAICMAAIAARRGVICEKPLATTTYEALVLRDAAAAAGLHTAVNFTYRSVLGYRLTERVLSTHVLGRPLHAEFALLQGHNFLPAFVRASALRDSGVHLLDAVAGLGEAAGMGNLREVCAAVMADTPEPDFGWGFTGRTTAGTVLSGTFSRSALGWSNGFRWSLYGLNAAILVEFDAERTQVRLARCDDERPQGVWRSVPAPPDLVSDDACFPTFHMDRLVGAVRGEEAFPGFAEAAATHRVADALAASARTRRWVAVEG